MVARAPAIVPETSNNKLNRTSNVPCIFITIPLTILLIIIDVGRRNKVTAPELVGWRGSLPLNNFLGKGGKVPGWVRRKCTTPASTLASSSESTFECKARFRLAILSFKSLIFARFCFAPYFSRRITSPWPTSWSFSHKRYLYVAALLPGRGGPLSNRIPTGA